MSLGKLGVRVQAELFEVDLWPDTAATSRGVADRLLLGSSHKGAAVVAVFIKKEIFEPRRMTRRWVLLGLSLVVGILFLDFLRQADQKKLKARARQEPKIARPPVPEKKVTGVLAPSPEPAPAGLDVISGKNAAEIAKAADDYALALAAFRAAESKQSLEPIFVSGQAVCRRIEKTTGPDGRSALELETDGQLAPILKKLPGFERAGEVGQGLLPDWKFFQQAANEKGTPADIAFFTLMLDSQGGNGFPTWTTQLTDYSGCTSYGSGILTTLYGRWGKFKSDFPQAYRTETASEIQAMSAEFTTGDCACDDKVSVIQEFNLFLRAHPDDALSRPVRDRLSGIQDGTVKFRYSCSPG